VIRFVNGIQQGWRCESCNLYNDALDSHCGDCKRHKPNWLTSNYQARVEIQRGIFLSYGIYGIRGELMTDEEKKYAEFYNHEKVSVKSMDDIELQKHREKLQDIAWEAKARLVAVDDEKRERRAKTTNKEWLVTDNRPDVKVSDAINVVEQRRARMSKMDKIRADLLKSGIDTDTVNEMIRNLEAKATNNKLKTITFKTPTTETNVVQVKTEKKVEDSKPFNPASLSFKCGKCGQNPCRCDGLQPVEK